MTLRHPVPHELFDLAVLRLVHAGHTSISAIQMQLTSNGFNRFAEHVASVSSATALCLAAGS